MFFLSLRRGLRAAAAWRVLVAIRQNSSGGLGVRRIPQRREVTAGSGDGAGRPISAVRGSASLLLAGDRALRALAGARVGLGPLTVDGQAATVAQALVAPDLDLAADVSGDLTAQVTLDHVVRFAVVAQLDELLVADLADPLVTGNSGGGQGLLSAGAAHAEDVRQGDFEALLARKVDSHQTCHVQILLLVRRPEPSPRPGLFQDAAASALRVAGLRPVVSVLLLCARRIGQVPLSGAAP